MSKYRNALPQLGEGLFLTDGGLETTLIFHDGIDLPYFASFDLLKSAEGAARLRAYYERYIAMAKRARTGFVLEGVTWRASPDWGKKLGYAPAALAQANRKAVALMADLRRRHESAQTPIVISANIGLLNLLPIPMLDGGHLVFYAMEAIRRRPLSQRVQEIGFQIGIAVVLMMVVFVNLNDLMRLGRRWLFGGG